MTKEKEQKIDDELDLAKLVSEAEKSFGCFTSLGSDPKAKLKMMSTGIEFLDNIIGGGFKRGGFHEFSGGFASGKTFIAQKAIAMEQIKEPNAIFVYIDAEHRFDPEWFKLTGVDLDKLIVQRPDNGEQAIELVIHWCKKKAAIVVIDSIASLLPSVMQETDMSSNSIGAQARMLSRGILKIVNNNPETVIIAINQLRQDIGTTYNRGILHKMPGGEAQYFYACLIVDVRRGEYKLDENKRKVGHEVNCLVTKCNYAPPFGTCSIPLIYKTGEIDIVGALVNVAIDLGLIGKKGGWYYLAGNAQPLQGLDTVTAYYKEKTEEFEALKTMIYSSPNDAV